MSGVKIIRLRPSKKWQIKQLEIGTLQLSNSSEIYSKKKEKTSKILSLNKISFFSLYLLLLTVKFSITGSTAGTTLGGSI